MCSGLDLQTILHNTWMHSDWWEKLVLFAGVMWLVLPKTNKAK